MSPTSQAIMPNKDADSATVTINLTDTDAIRPLMPDRWAQSHPEYILASREAELQEATARRRRGRAIRRQILSIH